MLTVRRALATLSVPLVVLLARGPALVAAGAENLGTLALSRALASVADQRVLPACGEQEGNGSVEEWLSVPEVLDAELDGWFVMKLGLAAWLRGDCVAAADLWDHACTDVSSWRVALPCLQLFLVSEGSLARPPSLPGEVERIAEYAYRFALRAERSGAPEQAVAAFRLSAELSPSRQPAERLSRLYEQQDRIDTALSMWKGLVELLPEEDEDHWWAAGRASELTQDWSAAARAYSAGARLAEDPYDFWMREARALRELAQWDIAEEIYRRAVSDYPERFEPYFRLGQVVHARQDYAQARGWYEDALALSPDNHDVMYHLSWTLYQAGELQRAVDVLARSVESHPRQPGGWAVQLGDWRLELGDQDGALDAYRQALLWTPGDTLVEQRIERITGSDE